MVMNNIKPGIDFTLSQAHTSVPVLSAEQNYLDTPLHTYRSAFREVIKLKLQLDSKPTVETKFRLNKWCTLGKGENAEWVYKAANDAIKFLDKGGDPMLTYEVSWINDYFKEKYENNL
tara:strand:- start:262 stop:615 length:354 start_codon:yes stop_codon:yes gene_type:complete